MIGAQIDVEFDLGGWAVLRGGEVEPLLQSAKGAQQAGMLIMVFAQVGEGSIFFTCFHNNAQTSKKERRLLQLLVVKQFSTSSEQSFEQAGKRPGLSLRQEP